MDFLTTPYVATVRISHDPRIPLVRIRWYFAPEGARVFPGEHAFFSNRWNEYPDVFPQPDLGEVDLEFRNVRSRPPAGVTGLRLGSPKEWFLHGVGSSVLDAQPPWICDFPAYDPNHGEGFVTQPILVELPCIESRSYEPDEGILIELPCVERHGDAGTEEILVELSCVERHGDAGTEDLLMELPCVERHGDAGTEEIIVELSCVETHGDAGTEEIIVELSCVETPGEA